MADLYVKVAAIRLDHRLYHFVLPFSLVEYANVVEAGRMSQTLNVNCHLTYVRISGQLDKDAWPPWLYPASEWIDRRPGVTRRLI
jgi:hypothetical protein